MLEFQLLKVGDIVAFALPNGHFSSPGIIIKQDFVVDGNSGGATATVVDMQHPFFSPGIVVPISLLQKINVSLAGDITPEENEEV